MTSGVQIKPDAAVDYLLRQGISDDFQEFASQDAWWHRYRGATSEWEKTSDRALIGGFVSDRPAYAFAAGYHSAILRLLPDLPSERVPAFCVTETGGVHPRAMETRLSPKTGQDPFPESWLLQGHKAFVTGADRADLLLVAATRGPDFAGRPRIKIACVRPEDPGVDIRLLDPLPFIPEIRHGEVVFKDVSLPADRVRPGDGYAQYVKPFRTIEDVHVMVSICGFLLRVGLQYGWPQRVVELTAAQSMLLASLAACSPDAPAGHVALAGARSQMEHLVAVVDPLWEKTDAVLAEWWQRDRSLLNVAGKARQLRTAGAWQFFQTATVSGKGSTAT